MFKEILKAELRDYPNFPKKGVNFKDITSLFLNPKICSEIVDSLINKLESIRIDAIVGIESRGFLFGFLMANKMGIPFIPIRKSGKLPGDCISCKYELEYGFAEIEVHKNDIKKGWNVLVHDDLLATGGTASAAAELMNQLHANVVGFAFVVSLDFLNGREILRKYSNNIISLKDY